MSKPVITFVFKVFAIDCVGTYSTHVQTCDNVHVQSATRSPATAHTRHMSKTVITFVFKVLLRNGLLRCILLHMSKPVITFVFKVIRNGLLRGIPSHMSSPVMTFVFEVIRNGHTFTHVQTRDSVITCVQSDILPTANANIYQPPANAAGLCWA